MSGYAKLFSDIVDSSIWAEPPTTCKVWVTLLALADRDGFVRGSIGWLAGKARVSSEECDDAMAVLVGPDEYSRTADNDGRRVEVLPDGFLVLNYLKFRDRLSQDATAVATRERVRRHRERYEALRNVTGVTARGPASASGSPSLSGSQEGDARGGDAMPADGWTWEQVAAVASDPCVACSHDAARSYYDTRAAVGWVKGKDGQGRPCARSRAALASDLRNWARVTWPSMQAERERERARGPDGRPRVIVRTE